MSAAEVLNVGGQHAFDFGDLRDELVEGPFCKVAEIATEDEVIFCLACRA